LLEVVRIARLGTRGRLGTVIGGHGRRPFSAIKSSAQDKCCKTTQKIYYWRRALGDLVGEFRLSPCNSFALLLLVMAEDRNEQVSLRMSLHETAMLKAIAALDGISQSDVLRMLLRREWMNRFGDKRPPKAQR